MKFICQKEDLIQGLSVASKASATRSPQAVLECVSIAADATGVHLMCTDLQMGIETNVPATVAQEGRVLLNARLFSEIVRKLPDGEVRLSVSETNRATISSGGSKTTLQGMSALDFPKLPQVDDTQPLEVSQRVLRDMILKTGFAVATEDARPILMGILMEVEGETLTLVALDGFRLARRMGPLLSPADPVSCVVSGRNFVEIAKILSDEDTPVSLALSKTHLKLNTGSATVVVRLLEGDYIKYRQLLPPSYAISVRLSRAELADCIDRASLMAREGKSNLLKFSISADKLHITSNSEMGDVYEEMDVETLGDGIDIAFNVRYISEAVKSIDDEQFLLKLNSNISPCVLVPTCGDDFLYLVLPVRTAG
jgi:DNA polymerase-3 subunit beta